MKLLNHILLIVLVPAIIVIGFVSYNRFIVDRDYLVSYQGDCDPETQDCYVGCEDEECTEEYYYSVVEKYAADVYAQCGPDITDCEEANVCLDADTSCSITYCDPESENDKCEAIIADVEETLEEVGDSAETEELEPEESA